MGAAAAPIIGGLVAAAGVGVSGYMANKAMKDQQSAMQAQLTQLQSSNTAANAAATLPSLPEAPTNNAADAETNEAEAERQRQLAASRANEAWVNPNGGLGVTSLAKTKKRTLGGAS